MAEKDEKKQWMDDKASSSCLICDEPFKTFTNRRHHCRHCLRLVCSACSSRTLPLAPEDSGSNGNGASYTPSPQRVCDSCYVEIKEGCEVEVVGREGVHEHSFGPGGAVRKGQTSTACVVPMNPTEYVLIKVSILQAILTGPELVGSLQGAGKSLYCRLVVARKTIGQTRVEVMTPLVGEPPAVSLAKDECYQKSDPGAMVSWSLAESFSFRVHLTCRTTNFATLELWKQAASKINSDELLARCRLPLQLWSSSQHHSESRDPQSPQNCFFPKPAIPSSPNLMLFAFENETDPFQSDGAQEGSTTVQTIWLPLLRVLGEKGSGKLGKLKLKVEHKWPESARMADHNPQWISVPTTCSSFTKVNCCQIHAGKVMLLHLFPHGSPFFSSLFVPFSNSFEHLGVAPVQEKVMDAVGRAQVQMKSIRCTSVGQLILTSHRLIFIPEDDGALRQGTLIKIPLTWVVSTRAVPHKQDLCLATLHVTLKDGRSYRFGIVEQFSNKDTNILEEERETLEDEEATLTVKHWEEEICWRIEEDNFHCIPTAQEAKHFVPCSLPTSPRSKSPERAPSRPSSRPALRPQKKGASKQFADDRPFQEYLEEHETERASLGSLSIDDKSFEEVSFDTSNCGRAVERSRAQSPRSRDHSSERQHRNSFSDDQRHSIMYPLPKTMQTTPFTKRKLPLRPSISESPQLHRRSFHGRSSVSALEELYQSNTAQANATAFDLFAEIQRQGIPQNSAWRICTLNLEYKLCQSYPRLLVVPTSLTDEKIQAAAKWRVHNRIPVLTWLHPLTGAPLCRSGQPKPGITNVACPEDEFLVISIRQAAVKYRHQNTLRKRSSRTMLANAKDTSDIPNIKTSRVQSPTQAVAQSIAPPLFEWTTKLGIGKPPANILSSSPNVETWIEVKPESEIDEAPLAGTLTVSVNLADSILPIGKTVEPGAFPTERSASDSTSMFGRKANGPTCERSQAVLRIFDARSVTVAKSNQLLGGGHESVSQLGGKKQCRLQFLNLPNIHVMRESYIALSAACCLEQPEENWLQAVHDSRWLHHIGSILAGAKEVARYLDVGDPVLVHCSDGWDRTSQLCSLAQIMLDPFYRTIQGLEVLIEKEWCSFGHLFETRNGYDNEMSPIFLQFLDCLWQLMQQYPNLFEYNDELLVLLFEASHSRFFGNFLKDREKDRTNQYLSFHQQPKRIPSVSIWKCIEFDKSRYKNVIFLESVNNPQVLLQPQTGLQSIHLWKKMYFQGIPWLQIPGGYQSCSREDYLENLVKQQLSELRRLGKNVDFKTWTAPNFAQVVMKSTSTFFQGVTCQETPSDSEVEGPSGHVYTADSDINSNSVPDSISNFLWRRQDKVSEKNSSAVEQRPFTKWQC